METHSRFAWVTPVVRMLVWLALSLVQIIPIFLAREAILRLMQVWQVNAIEAIKAADRFAPTYRPGFVVESVDMAAMLVMAVLAVGFAVGMDYYFRAAEKHNDLVRRILTVVGIQAGFCVVCILIITFVEIPAL
jgi:hypothetical protein